ncbi:YfhO family protein [Fructobacillus evanidus]|uniref:Uncharacterized membrane protein YfhO (YfhO) n=1 Tax=Fructobacillus evanidus TaxID=3064281 RepID=A0ABM9MPX5_9LACO|nr:Uncharacterized membrane protein YfhO (YfhO) [Fructobacillus sp. LMG 32999]CAK1231801.1 Uncharacterized membrane protein YfhO (YfhO) [Fructobacillus sp. LMG 32999]CAK1232779.1 Uncharacterized membrane protein YfhO (YfhO) [Fructobacillus sp. LMG 32999]CAK1235821.1 Uncharacterized membrane protein YfhO (YfhO) [Fructobacillus sp. LMG 32999]
MNNYRQIAQKYLFSPVTLSFLLPVILMTAYFAGRGMTPFGSSTILTVDLGQQYLDYFVQFKHTLLSDPSAFFYSFSSGIGGDMVGEWSYYLMSPFNLLFLLASTKTMPVWILVVTVLKIGLAGFSMALLIKKMNWLSGYWILIFAINYPLSAWFIANDLNLLWLDTAAILPLLILSLERLLAHKGSGAFLAMLVATIITNYYIAWMVGLFLFLYVPFRLLDGQIKDRLKIIFTLVKSGILSIFLTAWLWLPTYAQLKMGKTTHNSTWLFKFDNNPLLLFFKLMPGSFDFDQMQTGQANFLVAPLILIALWAFFASKKFLLREKLMAALILIVLILATTFAPLILLFHGGQYPVWYPARFSFLISFFLIVLAAKGFEPDWQPSLFARAFYLIAVLALTIWGADQLLKVTYLDKNALLGFLFGYLLTILILIVMDGSQVKMLLLLIVTTGYLIFNAGKTLNHLSYLTKATYEAGVTRLTAVSKAATQHDDSWYRISQGLSRTYNDGFSANFRAGSHFSSLLPATTALFYQNIGQIEGDSKIAYDNGTTITDSLLAFKYFIQTTGHLSTSSAYLKQSNRPDYDRQKTVASGKNWALKKNPTALSLAYAASNQALTTPLSVRYPLVNQANLLTYLAGQPNQQLLYREPFQVLNTENLTTTADLTGGTIQKINKHKKAVLTLAYTPTTNDSYYLNIGGAINLDSVDLRLNGKLLTQSSSYDHTVALNLNTNKKDQPQILTITLNDGANSRYLDDFAIYYFDQQAVNQDLAKLKQHPLTIKKANSRKISGTIVTTADQPLIMTSIPAASGWQAKVDGKVVKTKTVLQGLIAIPTTPGKHRLTLTYTPPLLVPGLFLSMLTVLLIAAYASFKKNRRQALRRG